MSGSIVLFPGSNVGRSARPSFQQRLRDLASFIAQEWRFRRDLAQLQALDTRGLRDIGLSRGGIESAIRHGRTARACTRSPGRASSPMTASSAPPRMIRARQRASLASAPRATATALPPTTRSTASHRRDAASAAAPPSTSAATAKGARAGASANPVASPAASATKNEKTRGTPPRYADPCPCGGLRARTLARRDAFGPRRRASAWVASRARGARARQAAAPARAIGSGRLRRASSRTTVPVKVDPVVPVSSTV